MPRAEVIRFIGQKPGTELKMNSQDQKQFRQHFDASLAMMETRLSQVVSRPVELRHSF
jgi:hypothetical protein